jgi:hypothetical protein
MKRCVRTGSDSDRIIPKLESLFDPVATAPGSNTNQSSVSRTLIHEPFLIPPMNRWAIFNRRLRRLLDQGHRL